MRLRVDMADVRLDKITKVYPNGFQAVTELTLELNDGEFLCLWDRQAVANPLRCA